MSTTNKENLHKCLKNMTRKEQAVLLGIIRQRKGWEETHIGMLPFLPRIDVGTWLAVFSALNGFHRSRLHLGIFRKIMPIVDKRILLELNDGRVRRRFGSHPERGITIPGIGTKFKFRVRRPFERRERGLHWDGVKWTAPESGPEAANAVDIQSQIVSLKNVGRNKWVLGCTDEVEAFVKSWLKENVG